MLLTAKTKRQGLKIPKRRALTKTKISCYTAYSKTFFHGGAITIINNKSITLRSTLCLTTKYRGICLVRHERRLHNAGMLRRRITGRPGVAFLPSAIIGRVYKRRVISRLMLTGAKAKRRGRLPIDNVFVTINVGPRASTITSILSLSRNCIHTKRSKIARRPKLFITKSIHAGGLHRVIATITSNTGDIADVIRCLGALWVTNWLQN